MGRCARLTFFINVDRIVLLEAVLDLACHALHSMHILLRAQQRHGKAPCTRHHAEMHHAQGTMQKCTMHKQGAPRNHTMPMQKLTRDASLDSHACCYNASRVTASHQTMSQCHASCGWFMVRLVAPLATDYVLDDRHLHTMALASGCLLLLSTFPEASCLLGVGAIYTARPASIHIELTHDALCRTNGLCLESFAVTRK